MVTIFYIVIDSKNGHSSLLSPLSLTFCNVTLQLLTLKHSNYYPNTWILAALVTCFDQ